MMLETSNTIVIKIVFALSDLGERASVGLKPGQEQERPKTVPKAKSFDFGGKLY